MKEFLMIFRNNALPEAKYSPDEMQAIMKQWENWMGGIAAQNKLANSGSRLGTEGLTIKPGNVIINGPYAEIKEIVGGYIIVRAESLEEAAEIGKGCPILNVGGNVELRTQIPMNG
ncbi:MAG: transcription initiation protein [Mucilaginibacter sp.]|nr:transcription initiation protein [Mucilaginibacter sp.]